MVPSPLKCSYRRPGPLAESVRIDKWLWAARFYKTRSLAAQAVDGGKVQLNGARVKRARALGVGDRLEIHKGGYEFRISVLALSQRRGPAKVAQSLYEESAQSIARRAALSEQHRLAAASTPHPQRKPDKKARRQLREMKW
ncbi:MAG: RNA-binding S4 domain-containing protein [Thiogranum sp.]